MALKKNNSLIYNTLPDYNWLFKKVGNLNSIFAKITEYYEQQGRQ